jgi:hypothetical protein
MALTDSSPRVIAADLLRVPADRLTVKWDRERGYWYVEAADNHLAVIVTPNGEADVVSRARSA